ncbi:MAG: hypothetical protein LBB21_00240 [Holosporaceae bacterium]|jgi:hypothetical protein|nr:hypothetical protein [Holosporaceae bacterium]
MNFVSVFVCVFCCLPGFRVVAMDLPTLAFSKNEGPALMKYHGCIVDHATHPSVIKYFMPRSESQLMALYNLYESGKIKENRYGVSPLKQLWWSITGNIQHEFRCRCEDGVKPVIDEYLSYFRSFIEISDNFQNQAFLEVLCSREVGSLRESLVLFILNLESRIKKSPDLTRESTYLPYAVDKIDEIFSASRNFRNVKLAEFYRTHCLTDEFRDSPEYLAMYNAIAGTFEEGVSLTDLCTKK